jgi:hypothetical protein
MEEEFERMWKEEVIAYFKGLSRRSRKFSIGIVSVPSEI